MICSINENELPTIRCDSDAMFEAVYSELKQLALHRIKRLPAGRTLHATVLVHETYLKLTKHVTTAGETAWSNPEHFIAAASEAMRRILIDHYRSRMCLKRGGEFSRIVEDMAIYCAPMPEVDLLALDEILDHFEWLYPEKAQVVKLRYFLGMSVPEVAQALGTSVSTVERHWRFSRAWLAEKIEHFHE